MNKQVFSFYSLLFLLLQLAPAFISAQSCDAEVSDRDSVTAVKYKVGAIGSILLAGAMGICLPVIGQTKVPALHPDKNVFFLLKAFAAGVILSTGFVHVFPDAFESLTSTCLPENPWSNFPFAGFIAMMGAIAALAVDSFTTWYYTRRAHAKPDNQNNDDPENVVPASRGHVHVRPISADEHQLIRHQIISQVLELGIMVHSVIIGISLGASTSPKTLKPLIAALTFHQFFEGMGLGGCIAQAKFKFQTVARMSVFFSLTTPLGIAIGFGLSNVYSENSPTALIVEGVFNSASSGILIYTALVDMLVADFANAKVQASVLLQIGVHMALLLGSGSMAVLAIWA